MFDYWQGMLLPLRQKLQLTKGFAGSLEAEPRLRLGHLRRVVLDPL